MRPTMPKSSSPSAPSGITIRLPGVRVGVVEPVLEDHLEEDLRAVAGNLRAIDVRGQVRRVVGELHAVEPLDGQDTRSDETSA